MTEAAPPPHEIRYHSRSRVLELGFADGSRFELPAGTLRRYAGVASHETAGVGITRIAPVAAGAIVLHFDDGFESRPLSWSELYCLGSAPSAARGGER